MRNHFLLFLSLVSCTTFVKQPRLFTRETPVVYPRHLVDLQQGPPATSDQKIVATRLHQALTSQIVPDSPTTPMQLLKMVVFIDRVRNEMKFSNSIYVTPDEETVFFPLQFYPNGHVYIHTEDQDPSQRSGTYKVFSRSIGYPDLQVYANLELKLEKNKAHQEMQNEIEILRALEGVVAVPHIEDFGFFQGKTAGTPRFSMQMELFTEDISERKKALEDGKQIVKLALEVVHVVRMLHEKAHYIHRDLKPKNFFWKKQGQKEIVVVADFGLGERDSDTRMGQRLVGTRAYLAPELSLHHAQAQSACESFQLCKKADVFALGVTLLDLIGEERETHLKKIVYGVHGPFLHQGSHVVEMTSRIQDYTRIHKAYYDQGPLEYGVHPQEAVLRSFRQLVWRMMHPDPLMRPDLRMVEDQLNEILEQYNKSVGSV